MNPKHWKKNYASKLAYMRLKSRFPGPLLPLDVGVKKNLAIWTPDKLVYTPPANKLMETSEKIVYVKEHLRLPNYKTYLTKLNFQNDDSFYRFSCKLRSMFQGVLLFLLGNPLQIKILSLHKKFT